MINAPTSFNPMPNGWRFLIAGDVVQENDIVLNEINMTPDFCISSNHICIGQIYDIDCLLMVRKITQGN